MHDFQDGLTINFAGDYRGGVTVIGNLGVTGDISTGTVTSIGNAIAAMQEQITSLQAWLAQLAQIVGVVAIPNWRTQTEVEEGDDMGLVSPSAEELGLVIEFQVDQRNPSFDDGDVISITPPAGTLVSRGTTVVVKINLEG